MNSAGTEFAQNVVKPDSKILVSNKCRRNYSLSTAKIYDELINFLGYGSK